MLYYILIAAVVIGLAYWFLKRGKKGSSGPMGGSQMPPPSQPSAPSQPQM